jgi:catechol 2,3-dioxygenase-like lactoylglutathione lyase family enzyme
MTHIAPPTRRAALTVVLALAAASAVPVGAEPAGADDPAPAVPAVAEATLAGHATADAAAPPSVGLGGNRLQQIAITTADLGRAIAFYRDVLGLPLLFESNGMAFFDVAGVRLMVALDPDRPATRPTSILYFDTPAFDATVAKLRALDLPLDGPVETVQQTAAGSLRLQQFRDPDGNALAVMGLVPAD